MPTKDRQRALARAKLERQMARRAEAARKRRQLLAAIGAGTALLLVVVGVGFLIVKYGGSDDDEPATNAAGPKCSYQTAPKATGTKAKDVGKPATTNIPDTGTRTATIVTNVGTITATLDQANAPCTVNSFAYLASKGYFNKTSCHRMTTSGLYVLQCGDPFATGGGGPSYQFANENLPTNVHPPYPAGTLAMANSGANTNGSQFFIVYKQSDLQPDYTVFGKISKGLDVVTKVAAKGVTPPSGGSPGDGKPKQPVNVTTVTTTQNAG